ncbi:MAG: M1 family metallopeptidase [Candidatus Promineifilaceae bacterium]|nr:M1 family metallopeptidase [Candidatus Promineifilaceae bacterium]
MKPTRLLLLLPLLALLLGGCAQDAPPTPALEPTALETAVDLATVSATVTVEESIATPGPDPAVVETPARVEVETESVTSAVAGTTTPPPAPTLFARRWEDPAPYAAGLIEAEHDALLELPRRNIYHLDLTLAADLRTVTGRQEVRFVNNEDLTLNELFFHLYPNLLGGSLTVTTVTINGQAAAPQLLNERSILAVPLDEPLAPDGSVVVGLDFTVQVPTEGSSNYGVFVLADRVLALAHFYPQVAVHDDEGWNISPPPANADPTYADAAFYLVRVTAPSAQTLVASGVVLERSEQTGQQTVTVAIGPARDFYLASSERYERISKPQGQTTINVFGLPGTESQMVSVSDFASGALRTMSELIGPYPYTEFDVAPTVNLALGVEYPGTVVLNSRLYEPEARFGALPATAYLESTVAHEVVHQWFYNVVGNDQLDEPWLDEALTQYGTWLYFRERYGPGAAENFRQSWVERWDAVNGAAVPIGLPAGRYEGAEYGAIVYGRGPLFFESLAEEMGQQVFVAFLRDYYQQNKWDIATGAELHLLAEAHCACQLDALFADWVGQP